MHCSILRLIKEFIIPPDSGRKNLPEASALAKQIQTAKMTITLLASTLSNFLFFVADAADK
jgi:hypothetical protein